MRLDAATRRLNSQIIKDCGGHLPGTVAAILHQRDDWETPPELFRSYDATFRFDLDPCANGANAVCARYFDAEDDGLRQSWSGIDGAPARVWLHPPHSQAHLWARKAVVESRTKKASIVALLPARTGDGWFHDFVLAYASEVRWLRGTPGFRLRHIPVNGKEGRPLPTTGFCVAIFRGGARG